MSVVLLFSIINFVNYLLEIKLAMVPLATKTASSFPNSSAARLSNSATVGSSPKTSSPTTAENIASLISWVGLLLVSLLMSMTRTSLPFWSRGIFSYMFQWKRTELFENRKWSRLLQSMDLSESRVDCCRLINRFPTTNIWTVAIFSVLVVHTYDSVGPMGLWFTSFDLIEDVNARGAAQGWDNCFTDARK